MKAKKFQRDRGHKGKQSLDVWYGCDSYECTSMKIFLNTNFSCLGQTICKKTASCNFWPGTRKHTKVSV